MDSHCDNLDEHNTLGPPWLSSPWSIWWTLSHFQSQFPSCLPTRIGLLGESEYWDSFLLDGQCNCPYTIHWYGWFHCRRWNTSCYVGECGWCHCQHQLGRLCCAACQTSTLPYQEQRPVLPLSLLASHAYVPLLGKGMYPAPIAGCSLRHPWKHPSGASLQSWHQSSWHDKEEQHKRKVEQLMKFL